MCIDKIYLTDQLADIGNSQRQQVDHEEAVHSPDLQNPANGTGRTLLNFPVTMDSTAYMYLGYCPFLGWP